MIVTPLDSAILDTKEQYVFYHKMVDFALKELIVAVQQHQILEDKEILLFKQYSDLLLYSIEAMRVKYMYDDEENMKVDLTGSETGLLTYYNFNENSGTVLNDISGNGWDGTLEGTEGDEWVDRSFIECTLEMTQKETINMVTD